MSREGTPAIVVIFLQPACNMHCTFCVTEDNFTPMRFEQAVKLLDTLRDEGVRTVIFGGGEPTDWPGDLFALTRKAKAHGFTVQIGTNGINLPDDFETIESVDRWVLPIESVDSEMHNRMRLYKGRHHAIILERLAALKRARKGVTLSTVMTEVNKAGVLDLAQLLREYAAESNHVHAWHLYQFLPVGRGGAVHGADLEIPEEEYRGLVEQVMALDLPFRVYRRSDMYQSQTVDFCWFEGDEMKRGRDEWG